MAAETDSNAASELWNPVEGPAMLVIGALGILLNVICLCALTHNKELKLSKDYLCLLCAQSVFDLLYIITSTPVTSLRSQSFRHILEPLFLLPWVFPFVQITMTASIYNTIALAVERYLSIRDVSMTKSFPCKLVITAIVVSSFAINIPRFFELRMVKEEESDIKVVNNTGIIQLDYIIEITERQYIKPVAEFYTLGYFLGYNMIGSFIISLFIPVVMLSVFNMLIWRRLKQIWSSRSQLGVQEKRNTKAALSLVLVIIMFFVCHSMKLVVSGYQLVASIITPDLQQEWPRWVEFCTFVSHFLLALNASVNILIFCSCDKRFFVVIQKMLGSWFAWCIDLRQCISVRGAAEAEPVNIVMKEGENRDQAGDLSEEEGKVERGAGCAQVPAVHSVCLVRVERNKDMEQEVRVETVTINHNRSDETLV